LPVIPHAGKRRRQPKRHQHDDHESSSFRHDDAFAMPFNRSFREGTGSLASEQYTGNPSVRIVSRLFIRFAHLPMANEFDPYREALVMESVTIWPEEYDELDPAERQRIEAALHAEPAQAAEMVYVRMHTGFQRQITVTPADLDRLGVKAT
jgi:hypothetical protein